MLLPPRACPSPGIMTATLTRVADPWKANPDELSRRKKARNSSRGVSFATAILDTDQRNLREETRS